VALFIVKFLPSLYSSDWVVYIDLSSNAWTLACVPSILLLSPSIEFSILVIVFLLFLNFHLILFYIFVSLLRCSNSSFVSNVFILEAFLWWLLRNLQIILAFLTFLCWYLLITLINSSWEFLVCGMISDFLLKSGLFGCGVQADCGSAWKLFYLVFSNMALQTQR
jgi:hypothetical protein